MYERFRMRTARLKQRSLTFTNHKPCRGYESGTFTWRNGFIMDVQIFIYLHNNMEQTM